MNKTLRALALSIAFTALSVSAFAQATMQSTTLSLAVPDATVAAAGTNRYVLSVASCTNILAPALEATQGGIGYGSGNNYYLLYADRELFRVNAVNTAVTPCQVTVERGVYGTRTSAHANGAKIWTGPANYYGPQDSGAGVVEPIAGTPCVSTATRALPFIQPSTGRAWNCATTTTSTVQEWTAFDPSVPTVIGATIASATTVAPAAPLTSISGTAAIATITVPAALPVNGCLAFLPTGNFTLNTSGNVTAASTAITGHIMTLCYNSVTSLWLASY